MKLGIRRSIGVGIFSAIVTGRSHFNLDRNFRLASFCDSASAASVPGTLCAHRAALQANPLMKKDGLPLFQQIQPSHVLPALTDDIANWKKDFALFETELQSPTGKAQGFAVVDKLERLQYPIDYSWGVVQHLMSVKNSDDLRKAQDEIQPKIIELGQQRGQSQALFAALKNIKDSPALWAQLDESQQRIVSAGLRDMSNKGVGLVGAEKERFNKLAQESAELQTKFSNNVLDSTKAFKLVVTDKAEVEGLPSFALAAASQQAIAAGHKDSTPEAGPWVLSMDLPSYLPAMQHIKNRGIREQLYRAYVSRASTGVHDNVPIITRVLQIKQEMTRILGYPTYAHQSLAKKMAPSVEKVLELIEMLRSKALPAAQKELQELKEFAAKEGCEYSDNLCLWDIPFWSERMREKNYEFQEEDVRPYFTLPAVLGGLFSLSTRLFGISIEAADGEAEVWHPDVRFFKIKDTKTGEHLASFFLDPYSRPADKRGGAWMNVCVQKSKVMSKKPVAYLICNSGAPVGDKPALLSFREVETLFHEFGHGLQHMLTTVEHHGAAGINGVEWDAVELPSQFMENWCYDRPTLFGMAKHYATGEALPEELFQKLLAAKTYQAGLQTLRQLYFGALDITLHSTFDPNGTLTPFDVQKSMYEKYTVIPPLPEDRFLCSFSHIFAGGYSAGYYSYKWAEVMSADAFAAFEEKGLTDEQAVQSTGRLFRNTVLAMGGGKHPGDVFQAFRGREPSPEALLRHNGLSQSKQ